MRRPKGKIGMELCPPCARANCWKEKKTTRAEETGKAYQTGFQITEVIPSVIDSPIATYRISAGSSREGNYKGGGRVEKREMDRRGERKRGVCVSGRDENWSGRKERNKRWR